MRCVNGQWTGSLTDSLLDQHRKEILGREKFCDFRCWIWPSIQQKAITLWGFGIFNSIDISRLDCREMIWFE